MQPGLIWLLAGLVACGAELLLPGVFLLWIGLAAAGAGLLTLALGAGFAGQVGAFVLLLAMLLVPAVLRRRPARATPPDDALIGRACWALRFEGASGRVRLGDGSWPARDVTGGSPAPDAPLRVVGRDGMTLLVDPGPP